MGTGSITKTNFNPLWMTKNAEQFVNILLSSNFATLSFLSLTFPILKITIIYQPTKRIYKKNRGNKDIAKSLLFQSSSKWKGWSMICVRRGKQIMLDKITLAQVLKLGILYWWQNVSQCKIFKSYLPHGQPNQLDFLLQFYLHLQHMYRKVSY